MLKEYRVECNTNLDIVEVWPDYLPARPMVGDYIISKRGLELIIVKITFDGFIYAPKPEAPKKYGSRASTPYTKTFVELGIPNHINILEFMDWYNKTKDKSLR